MEEIIKIIMKRDGLDRKEAAEEVQSTMNAVGEAIEQGRFELAEDIFMEDLGLEPDYLMNAVM